MKGIQKFFDFACLLFFCAFFAISCASSAVQENRPAWAQESWREAFPDSVYLAERGTADNAALSKTEALAALSRYISTSVNANLTTSIRSMDSNGVMDETISIQNDVSVSSQVNLFGVEFTEPYFSRKEKKWYCVAYIDRERAWEQYVPQIEVAKKIFDGFYREAENGEEPLFICSFYKKAWEKGKDFLTKLEYGRLINPAREKSYSADRMRLALIPSQIEAEMKNISVSIHIEGDYGGIVETAIANAFKKAGFTVSRRGNYTADVSVLPNAMGNDPIAVFPSVDVKLVGRTGRAVYSYKDRISERTTAFSLENALKKSYPKLSEKIEREMSSDLSEITEAN